MRVLFYFVLITVGLSLSIAILVPSFFDLNTYKSKLYKFVETQTGYSLEIKGPIKISVFPKLNFNAKNIILKNNNEVLFTAKNLNIYPSISSILKGDVSFNGMKLDTAEIFIRKNKDKTYNWNTKKIVNKESQKIEVEDIKSYDKKKRENNKSLSIRNLNLTNSSVEYQDIKSKYNFENLSINLKQNLDNNYQFNGAFNLNKKNYSFKYKAKASKMNIDFDGELSSEFYDLSNSGQFNINENRGKLSVNGYIKNLKSLTKTDDLKINELFLSCKINFDKNNLKFNNLKLKAKEQELNGYANFKLNKNKRFINLSLNSEFLNLDKIYLSKEKNMNTPEAPNNQKKITNNKKKNLNKNIFKTTKHININSNLSVKSVFYKNVYLDDLQLKVNKTNDIKINFKARNFFKSELTSKFILNKNMKYSFDNSLKNLSLTELNNFYKVDLINGDIDIYSNLSGEFDPDEKVFPFRQILFNSVGESSLKGKNLILKNINLNDFKTKVSQLNNLKQIKELNRNLFNGNTFLGNQEIKLYHEKENLNLALTKLKFDDENIYVSGKYNINKKNIELVSSYGSKSSILSLLSIKTKGKISNPVTTISFDEDAVTIFLKKLTEKKLKKSLEKKFDNIIENLLD
ncbi:AsmA family protein [Alphaproteobacteria bacterium]|nr:AsmA family protein [Alphaproteobacteria bacterium]